MSKKQRIDEIKAELQKRLQKKKELRKKRKPASPAPRYDDVYFEGLKWLNQL
jgi:TPP-dependent pyruvate/acetoin dehydrogenase alpha subunit